MGLFDEIDLVTENCALCTDAINSGVRVFTPDFAASNGMVGTSLWCCLRHADELQRVINAHEMHSNQQQLFKIP